MCPQSLKAKANIVFFLVTTFNTKATNAWILLMIEVITLDMFYSMNMFSHFLKSNPFFNISEIFTYRITTTFHPSFPCASSNILTKSIFPSHCITIFINSTHPSLLSSPTQSLQNNQFNHLLLQLFFLLLSTITPWLQGARMGS